MYAFIAVLHRRYSQKSTVLVWTCSVGSHKCVQYDHTNVFSTITQIQTRIDGLITTMGCGINLQEHDVINISYAQYTVVYTYTVVPS